jgi:hypothetical protein
MFCVSLPSGRRFTNQTMVKEKEQSATAVLKVQNAREP